MAHDSTTVLGTTDARANVLVNANTAGTDKLGVFTSSQSLVTFPGATAAVSVVWSVLKKVDGDTAWAEAEMIALLLSIVVGILFYLTSVQPGGKWRDHLMGGSVALVNSFMITAAVIGAASFQTSSSVPGGNGANGSNTTVAQAKPTPSPTPPPTVEELRIQAESSFDSNDFQTAVQKYTELIALQPNESWHYKDRGNSYRRSGGSENFVLAVADYSKALELIEITLPEDAIEQKRELFLDRGNTYRDLNEREKAKADFKKVCQVDQNSSQCTAAKKELKKP